MLIGAAKSHQSVLAIPQSLAQWQSEPGQVISWKPCASSIESIARAEIVDIPPSHQQEQHLLSFQARHTKKTDFERLIIVRWQLPGHCDIKSLTDAIHFHLHSHDTYHSWLSMGEDKAITRRLLDNPATIKLEPCHEGWMNAEELITHIAQTPPPTEWGCFQIGIIQTTHFFTLYACIDHLYTDSFLIPILHQDLVTSYKLLTHGAGILGTERSSYLDYCKQQRAFTDGLSPDHPLMAQWLEILKQWNGALPIFPLALGEINHEDPAVMQSLSLFNSVESLAVQKAFKQERIPFIFGLMSALAVVEHQLTGKQEAGFLTPISTRKSKSDQNTLGWYTGVVPCQAALGSRPWSDVARDLQASFRRNRALADLPLECVLTRATTDDIADSGHQMGYMVSYMDTSFPPLHGDFSNQYWQNNSSVFMNVGSSSQVALWFTRSPSGLSVTASHPNTTQAVTSILGLVAEVRIHCLELSHRASTRS